MKSSKNLAKKTKTDFPLPKCSLHSWTWGGPGACAGAEARAAKCQQTVTQTEEGLPLYYLIRPSFIRSHAVCKPHPVSVAYIINTPRASRASVSSVANEVWLAPEGILMSFTSIVRPVAEPFQGSGRMSQVHVLFSQFAQLPST